MSGKHKKKNQAPAPAAAPPATGSVQAQPLSAVYKPTAISDRPEVGGTVDERRKKIQASSLLTGAY